MANLAATIKGSTVTQKLRLYYYPNTGRAKSKNPYGEKLMLGLANEFDVVNRSSSAKAGLFDIISYIAHIDVFFCSWIENVPDRKGGYVQALFLLLLLRVMNAMNVKIVWVLHNKISHSKSNLWMKKRLVKSLLVRSDAVLTHSSEGIDFAASIYPESESKTHFLHHPTEDFTAQALGGDDFACDVLIWGSMDPYKGVLELLEYVAQKPSLDQVSFLVWGRFSSNQYYEDCMRFQSNNIKIRNQFISEQELEEIQNSSRVILFAYQDRSVLSSGALIRSLNSRAMIVGPSSGAFKDLAKEGCIEVYRDLDELAQLLESAMQTPGTPPSIMNERARFSADNSWARTSQKINQIVLDKGSGGR